MLSACKSSLFIYLFKHPQDKGGAYHLSRGTVRRDAEGTVTGVQQPSGKSSSNVLLYRQKKRNNNVLSDLSAIFSLLCLVLIEKKREKKETAKARA